MIPKPFIAQWQNHAPWKQFAQVEQDISAKSNIFSKEGFSIHLENYVLIRKTLEPLNLMSKPH